ncbi:Protein LemA [Nymphon striatum]|nr:Protein LemA [Nymphon striatum]
MAIQSKSLEEIALLAKEKEKLLAAIPAIQPINNDNLTRMASGFGWRSDPFTKARKMHRGMDFTAPKGTPIYASGDGKIIRADNNSSGFGKHIRIDHGMVLGILAFIIYDWSVGFNNTAVEHEANAKTAWSNVESSYQRRNDLIGNLVKTVQGAADFEKGTLTDVIEARSKATSINIDANNLTPDKMAAFQQAQSGMAGALSKLMVVVERYPELKAKSKFLRTASATRGYREQN